MNTQNLPVRDGKGKNWPDFYSILNSTPEIDTETLRLSINALYIKANQESDHRELSIRFYNQVLTQKVLPQCRRILLDEVSRQAYDQQWYLHRDGAEDALSYPDFIRKIAKDSGTERALLLSADEISILPSFSSPGSPSQNVVPPVTPVVSVPRVTSPTTGTSEVPEAADIPEISDGDNTEVVEGEEVIEAPVAAPAYTSPTNSFVVAPNASPSTGKKAFPVIPVVAGVLLLGVAGFAFKATHPDDELAPDPSFTTGMAEAKAKADAKAASAAAPAPAEGLDHPLLRLNTLALNADFETGRISPWVPSNKQVYVENAPLHNAKSGNGIMTFWDTVPYDANVHQNITGLTPGKYTLRAWTQRTGGQERAEMSVTGYGGPTRIVTLPAEPTWTLTVIRDIDVKIDRCTIGFSAKAPATKHVQVDCVEFFKQ